MMTRRTQLLLTTHVLTAALGYGLIHKWAARPAGDAPEFTKVAVRSEDAPAGDGASLLADFLEEQSGKKSRYEELKATLPMAKDLRGAVISAVEGLGGRDWKNGPSADQQTDRLAEVEVRVWHWMRQNPAAAMGFVIHDADCVAAGLPALLNKHVFPEIVSQGGVLKSIGWLARSEAAFPTLCGVALDEIRGGGGLALFAKLDDAISRSPVRDEFRIYRSRPLAVGNPAYDGQPFLHWVGAATRYENREALWKVVTSQDSADDQFELFAGFAQSGGPAAEWTLALLKDEKLDRVLPDHQQAELRRVIRDVPALEMAERLKIVRADAEDGGAAPRQDPVAELAAADVRKLLENGRDWRFEFRSEMASAEDVLRGVRSGLGKISPLAEDAVRVAVYRQLAEENPKRALPLLEVFPADKRREILFSTASLAFENVSPADFLRFLADVPDARTAAEQELKIRGWNAKARGNLRRYGDDYVEWVMKIPPGIHREAAMNSVLWATAEANPAAARELSEKFYPRKP